MKNRTKIRIQNNLCIVGSSSDDNNSNNSEYSYNKSDDDLPLSMSWIFYSGRDGTKWYRKSSVQIKVANQQSFWKIWSKINRHKCKNYTRVIDATFFKGIIGKKPGETPGKVYQYVYRKSSS